MDKAPIISDTWVGQDGRTYRSVQYWVGAGWTGSYHQVQDDILNWHGV